MSSVETPLRIVSADEVWEENENFGDIVFSHIAIVAFHSETAYHRTTPMQSRDLDREALMKTLRPISREDIYPDDGRIIGLTFVKYNGLGLFERVYNPESFGEKQRNRCVGSLKAAVQYLYDLGLTHNDLTPLNVMFTDDSEPVLLDLTCVIL
ncbi:unnamed protein product [Penicillium salamii]|nr:unnamed protein product [Penicillium salamii]